MKLPETEKSYIISFKPIEQNVNPKFYSWTQCDFCVNRCDWCGLVGNEKRIRIVGIVCAFELLEMFKIFERIREK